MSHKHRWQRLSDTALFCECGETKQIALPPLHACPQPVVYPAIVVPVCPEPRPYWRYPNTTWPTITVSSTLADMTGVTVWNNNGALT